MMTIPQKINLISLRRPTIIPTPSTHTMWQSLTGSEQENSGNSPQGSNSSQDLSSINGKTIYQMSKEELQMVMLCFDYYQREAISDQEFIDILELRQQLDRTGTIHYEFIPLFRLVLKKAHERYGENYTKAQDTNQPENILVSIRDQMNIISLILQRI